MLPVQDEKCYGISGLALPGLEYCQQQSAWDGVDAGYVTYYIPQNISSCASVPAANGVYRISNVGGAAPFLVFCVDGFALLAKMDGQYLTWELSADAWTQGNTFNTDSLDMEQVEAKFEAFLNVPFSTLRLGFADIGDTSSTVRWLDITFAETYPNLQSLFSAPSCQGCIYPNCPSSCFGTPIPINTGGRSSWITLIGEDRYGLEGANCGEALNNWQADLSAQNFYGAFTYGSYQCGSQARIGFRGNDGSGCTCTDSVIGLGMISQAGFAFGNVPTVGNVAQCCGTNRYVNISSFGYLLAG
jgi:hypothetical protein